MGKKRIVILGDGLLGSELHRKFGWDIISRKKNGFDITKKESLFNHLMDVEMGVIAYKKYDIVINCIANTDTLSTDKNAHRDVNFKFPVLLTEFCNFWNIKLVHISTSYVYHNSVKPSSVDDVPCNGQTWYSYFKSCADAYVESFSNDFLIIRGLFKPNIYPHDVAWENQVGSICAVSEISDFISMCIDEERVGIFNAVYKNVSMYDFAKSNKIAQNMNMFEFAKLNHIRKNQITEEHSGKIPKNITII